MPPSFTYSVRIEGRPNPLPEVTDLADFAGIQGRAITDIAIRASSGSVRYRVHVVGRDWLPYVTGCNWSDPNNGYAGDRKPIDLVEVIHSECEPHYRVSPVGQNYYPWQEGNKKATGFDGYAGAPGRTIDRFQIYSPGVPKIDDQKQQQDQQKQRHPPHTGQRIADLARSKCGCPYVSGAAGPNQFDCSGLVQWCHAQVGISVPRTSAAQSSAPANAQINNLDALQPGDVLFFSESCNAHVTHCAISLGGRTFVHAPVPGQTVKEATVAGSYWLARGRFRFAKRFW